MRKLMIFLVFVSLTFTMNVFAEPGDILVDRDKAIWLIATKTSEDYPDGIIENLLEKMAAIPEAYTAEADQQEWANWLKFDISLAFGGKIFNRSVYAAILYAVEGYNFGDPRIADERKAPNCTAGVGQITCDEDPTGAERPIRLWRYVSGEFMQQTLEGVLSEGTWTFSGIPGGTGNLTLAYEDAFQSFPTVFLTVESPE